jgi:hypothetical protein
MAVSPGLPFIRMEGRELGASVFRGSVKMRPNRPVGQMHFDSMLVEAEVPRLLRNAI